MPRVVVAAVIILLTGLGYLVFPGHHYLRQDSQIYVPILEHLWNPAVLAADPVAVEQHVSYSAYDELMLFARRATGLGFEPLMKADQLLWRAVGIFGVWLLATACGLPRWLALLVAAAYAAGAWVHGPEVLTVEYEPKPRASALAALLLAIGLLAYRRYVWGAVAVAVAVLYHPPTTYPFLAAYAVWLVRPRSIRERAWSLAPLCVAAVLIYLLVRAQAGTAEPLSWLETLSPSWEEILRARAAYVFVATWWSTWVWQYLLLWAVAVVAAMRLRKDAPEPVRYFLFGLPLVGMLSLPASFLLLDEWKWALMARFQPARALLFVVLFAVVLGAVAALRAAQSKRIPEAIAWTLALVLFFTWSPLRPTAAPAWSDTSDLDALSAWAHEQTPQGAVFLFADSGRRLDPGLFRAEALRAIYVDWKGGGQSGLSERFADEWWRRWSETAGKGYAPGDELYYRAMGIDYYVLTGDQQPDGTEPLYENETYRAYLAR